MAVTTNREGRLPLKGIVAVPLTVVALGAVAVIGMLVAGDRGPSTTTKERAATSGSAVNSVAGAGTHMSDREAFQQYGPSLDALAKSRADVAVPMSDVEAWTRFGRLSPNVAVTGSTEVTVMSDSEAYSLFGPRPSALGSVRPVAALPLSDLEAWTLYRPGAAYTWTTPSGEQVITDRQAWTMLAPSSR